MILAIQQTALLVMAVTLAWMVVEPRDIDRVPYWQAAVIVFPFLGGIAVLVATTLIRIWS